jgi:hypothetical protein
LRLVHCDECAFRYDLDAATASGSVITTGAGELAGILSDRDAAPSRRRNADTWSLLEYGCHVRDVLLVQRERVLAARRRNGADCPPMGRDERVDHDGYADQEPADVARQLTDAALLFVNVLDRLGPDDWERMLIYNYPEPAERSLRWLAVHTEHEVRHHLLDVRRQLA